MKPYNLCSIFIILSALFCNSCNPRFQELSDQITQQNTKKLIQLFSYKDVNTVLQDTIILHSSYKRLCARDTMILKRFMEKYVCIQSDIKIDESYLYSMKIRYSLLNDKRSEIVPAHYLRITCASDNKLAVIFLIEDYKWKILSIDEYPTPSKWGSVDIDDE